MQGGARSEMSDGATAVLGRVRTLVADFLIPAEADCDETQSVPVLLMQRIRESGVFGMSVPKEYGGLGLSMCEQTQLLFEFCRAAPGYRTVLAATVGLGSKAILVSGTPTQKDSWLPKIAAGETIVSFCLTEPTSGSDAAALQTTATRDRNGWVINGSKRFVSNAGIAQLFIVLARTSEKNVSAFLVDADTAGINVSPAWKKMGQRASRVHDVEFKACRVPYVSLLGDIEGQGFKTALMALDDGRIHMAAVAVGVSRRLMDESVGYALSRQQFGKPIAEFQLIQAMIADGEADLRAAQALVEKTALSRDMGENVTLDAASCKYFSTEALWRIADRALQIHGGLGYVSETAVERLFRDSRIFRILDGTSQIMQLVIAREVMKNYISATKGGKHAHTRKT